MKIKKAYFLKFYSNFFALLIVHSIHWFSLCFRGCLRLMLIVGRGLVRKSVCCGSVSTNLIAMFLQLCSQDQDQGNRSVKNLARGGTIGFPFLQHSKLRAPRLSSRAVSLNYRNLLFWQVNPLAFTLMRSSKEIAAQKATESAVFSNSIAQVAIVVCNF